MSPVPVVDIEMRTRSAVSVPVLSEQRIRTAPRLWMASKRFTMTFLRATRTADSARLDVCITSVVESHNIRKQYVHTTIIGSISGVMPTAIAMANMIAPFQFLLTAPWTMNTIGAMTCSEK